MTLFALDGSEIPQPLYNLDLCRLEETTEQSRNLAELLGQQHNDYALLLVHDTLQCSETARDRITEFFADTPLENWQELAFRQGYIALLDKKGQPHELPSASEQVNAVAFLRKPKE